jgi:hypothetical protein
MRESELENVPSVPVVRRPVAPRRRKRGSEEMSRAMLALIWIGSASAAAAKPRAENNRCDAPKYQVPLVYSQTSEQTALAVSIKPRDVTVKNLLALACQVRKDYPNASIVLADIFNDHDAAKHTSIHGVENPKRSNEGAYIGYYRIDRNKGIETLTLAVDVNHPCGNDIEIDLVNKKASVLACN